MDIHFAMKLFMRDLYHIMDIKVHVLCLLSAQNSIIAWTIFVGPWLLPVGVKAQALAWIPGGIILILAILPYMPCKTEASCNTAVYE